jgi:tetratricopeptide (TPR) repeat protein
MNDRSDLLKFIETHCDDDRLLRLAQAVDLAWETPPDAPRAARIDGLLRCAERDGKMPALLARLETDFPPPPAAADAPDVSEETAPSCDSAHPPAEETSPARALHDSGAARKEANGARPAANKRRYADTQIDFEQAVTDFETLREAFAREVESRPAHLPFRFVHGYTLPTHWARRDAEISELAAEIRDNRYRILSLVAIGGTGKSALTRKLLDELPKRHIHLDGALWFSFYVEPDFDRFLTEACRYLLPAFVPKAHPSPFEKGVLLREAMEQGHYLFVLDGIEVLQVSDPERRDFGALHDRALAEFLDGVCDCRNSQLLISSRFPLAHLATSQEHRAFHLGDLTLEAADELLSSYGVEGETSDRSGIYARFGCHVLTLQVLADYLICYHDGNPQGIAQIPDVAHTAPQGIKLQAALDGYWQRLQPDERFFLTRMSAFRGGVDERSLIVLNRNEDLSDPGFRAMVTRLLQSPLVTVERREGPARLTSHPLIKTFFYERMGEDERTETHCALKDYAQGLPMPDHPHTLQDYEPLVQACHHCLRVGLYREAYQIYRRNNMDNALRWWGQYAQANELLEQLRAATQGDVPAWQCERWQKSWVENETALLAALRGDMGRAVERFRRSVQLDAESGDGSGESASWQNLASVLTQRGDFREALKALERARILEAMLGRFEKEDMLAGLEGVCRMELGQAQASYDLLSGALHISQQRPNLRAVCYWTWRMGDLFLRAARRERGRQMHDSARQLAQQEQFRDYEGHALRGLGDADRLHRRYEEARTHYTAALRLARTLGNPYLENEVRMGEARLAEAEGNAGEAQIQARQVMEQAEESGFHVQATEAHLLLTRIACAGRDADALVEHVRAARRLLEQTCHYATRMELDRLMKAEPMLRELPAVPVEKSA